MSFIIFPEVGILSRNLVSVNMNSRDNNIMVTFYSSKETFIQLVRIYEVASDFAEKED